VSVPANQFAFQRPVSPGGGFPPIAGTPLDEPGGTVGGGITTADWTIVTKKIDEPVVSSTVLQSDDHLFFPVVANTYYEVDLSLFVMSASNIPDLLYDFTPAAGAISGEWLMLSARDGLNFGQFPGPFSNTIGSVSDPNFIRCFGGLRPNTTCILNFQWAQVSSSATPLIMKAGSRLRHRRLG
jgi:hypothetical protein